MQKIYWLISFIFFLAVTTTMAQKGSVSGTVNDTLGEPVIGASVYIKGTTLGTVTDGNGCFKIKNINPGNYKMVISFIGYKKISDSLNITDNPVELKYVMKEYDSGLGEIVVTGTSTPHHLSSVPVQTELVSKKLIADIAPSGLTDLMTNVSPSFDFSPGSMGSFMQLNGLGNDYILVLVDGKRLYGDVGGQTDLSRINPDDIERIEVVKGASSALYGSEAIAGVINIITKKAKNKIKVSNSSRIGSYGEWIQHNSLDLNLGKISSSTSYDRKHTDGWQLSPYETDDDTLIETDAMAQNKSTDYTINQKFTYAPTQKLSIYAEGTYYERDVERPESVGNYGYLYNDLSYNAGAKYLLKKKNYVQADWSSDNFDYYYKYNQEYKDYADGDEELQTEQQRDALNLNGFFVLPKSQKLTVGGEYVNESLTSEGRIEGESADAYTLAAYAQDEIKIKKKLSLVAGLRYVNHKEFGNALTPKFSALYKISKFNIRATYSRGFKAPTLKELYYHYEKRGSLYLGNTELKPQTSNYYSASVEYIIKKLSINLSAYRNDVNDLIDYQTVETSDEDAANGITKTRQHYNISEARTQGIDFIFNANIGYGFSLGGGYSFVDAQNLTDSIRLENVAKNYANIRLGYLHKWKKYKLSANISGRFQDEKFYEDDENAKTYNLWKLTTTHYFDLKGAFDFEASAGIDNIFDYVDDSPYGSHYGTISPGRTFFVGIKIDFTR